MSKPITIRGVRYASHSEAAQALGVSRETISVAERRGKTETVGLTWKAVEIDGVAYRSIREAARVLGIRWADAKAIGTPANATDPSDKAGA